MGKCIFESSRNFVDSFLMIQKPLKIGIDARMFSDAFTGIGRYNFELTKRLFKVTEIDGQKLEWVIFLNDPQFAEFEFPSHVKKVRVNAGHYSLAEQTKFLAQLYAANCDLVHFTHFNLPLLYRKPFVVTIHDTTISFYPGKRMKAWWHKLAYKLVIRRAVRASRHIITVSEHTKQDVLKLFSVQSEKISPIHIAPAKEFKPVSEAAQVAIREKYQLAENFLLYTGNWREHKNLVGLIRAFGTLKQKPEHQALQLVITGKEDPYYPEVKQTIAELGLGGKNSKNSRSTLGAEKVDLESSVKLVGLVPLEDLVALFNAARVYVCPSFYEGFGLPPLEAMGCGTVVACSNAASLPEVCGNAAVYFNPHSTEDMTAQIYALLTDPAQQKKLQQLGVQQTKTFSWDRCAKATLEVYKSAL